MLFLSLILSITQTSYDYKRYEGTDHVWGRETDFDRVPTMGQAWGKLQGIQPWAWHKEMMGKHLGSERH